MNEVRKAEEAERLDDVERGMESLGYSHVARGDEVIMPLTTASRCSKLCAFAFYCMVTASVLWYIGNGLEERDKRFKHTCIAVALALSMYLLVQWSDPGYVSNDVLEVAPTPAEYSQRLAAARKATESARSARQSHETFSSVLPWPDWPPMRAAYCRVTKRWIYTYDHFCPIVAAPIGERNRGRFLLFLTVQSYALGRVATLSQDTVVWQDIVAGIESRLIASFLIWVLALSTFAFWLFHSFLAATNMTMHEFLRADTLDYLYNTEDFDLPFSRGLFRNLFIYFRQDGLFGGLLFRCGYTRHWTPVHWSRPLFIDRNSSDCLRHPWQNKFYSCC